jgi:hypothetical protein
MAAPTFLELARSIDRKLAGNVNWPLRTLSALAEAISQDDYYLKIDASLNNVVATLPDAADAKPGLPYWFIRVDGVLANTVTIATTGGQTINGAASASIASQYSALQVVSDGTNWFLFAGPSAFALKSDVLWVFPNTVSNDQNPGLYTYYAAVATSFVGFDIEMNVAPTGQDIIVDWEVNGVINPAYRVTLPANDRYVELLVPVTLAIGDTLKPTIPQVGTLQPGQTMAIRARGI